MERFLRIRLLLGDEVFDALSKKRVTIIGIGAVGSYAAEALARSGVNNLRLVDFDKICKSNINRQLFAAESTIGMLKVDAAEKRILDINPYCNIEKLPLFAHNDTLDKIFDNNPDIVIDAIDSLNPKIVLLSETYKKKIPIISSMGAALKTDPVKIRIDDIFNTKHCRLARLVRKGLRKRGVGKGITCVYTTEIVNFKFTLQEDESVNDNDEYGNWRKRNVLGSMATITGIFGLILANIAIEKLTGIKLNNK